MRRLAPLLLAGLAAPLLAGCPTSPPPDRVLEVRWTLRSAAGATIGCAQQAPVATTVRVIADRTLVATAPCADGAVQVEGLPAGPHRLTVEALSGQVLAYRAWADVTVAPSGLTRADLAPARGTLHVDYSTTTGLCRPETDPPTVTSYMWFRLTEDAYGIEWQAITDQTTGNAVFTYQCIDGAGLPADAAPLRFELPWGNYTLQWLKAVLRPDQVPPTRRDLYAHCTPLQVTVEAAPAAVVLPVELAPVVGSDTACTTP
jgi:hypothetical protein